MEEQFPYYINTCFMCKNEFKVSRAWNGTRRFCSFECRQKYRKQKGFWDD